MGRKQSRLKGKERGKGTPRNGGKNNCRACGRGLSKTRIKLGRHTCPDCE